MSQWEGKNQWFKVENGETSAILIGGKLEEKTEFKEESNMVGQTVNLKTEKR